MRTENSDSGVLVMKPADQGMRHDATDPLNRARDSRWWTGRQTASGAAIGCDWKESLPGRNIRLYAGVTFHRTYPSRLFKGGKR